MTDAVVIAVATFATSLVSAIMTAFNYYISQKSAKVIEVLEKNTNSMKDALIASTAKASTLEGHAQGVADQKAVQDDIPFPKLSP